jgi:hypothetical protein
VQFRGTGPVDDDHLLVFCAFFDFCQDLFHDFEFLNEMPINKAEMTNLIEVLRDLLLGGICAIVSAKPKPGPVAYATFDVSFLSVEYV